MFERPTDEERPFVQAVCAAPADYAPRLVFADWLEDRGDPRGEYLRCAVAIEQAIEGLGWGYAFSSWRDALPHILRHQGIEDSIAPVWAASTAREEPTQGTLSHWLEAHFRRGGFIENAVVRSLSFKDGGATLAANIPLRGLLSPRYGRSSEGGWLWGLSLRVWEDIERLALPLAGYRDGTEFTPFATADGAAKLVERAKRLHSLAVHFVSNESIENFAYFLDERPLRSLLILSDNGVATHGLYGLLERWNPSDLRCLGLPHCSTLSVAELAEWHGLRNLRLLDVTRYEFTEDDWQALARSVYRREDLIILHRQGHRLCVRRIEEGRPADLCAPRWRSTPVLESVFDSPF